MSIPTDWYEVKNISFFLKTHLIYLFSPQRDERKGWMGDAALSINEALYNFDLIKFYIKFSQFNY